MPRVRERVVPKCDCRDCQELGDTDFLYPTASTPAARQEPPPKCLVVVLSGAWQRRDSGQFSIDAVAHPTLDQLVQEGSLESLVFPDHARVGLATDDLALLLDLHMVTDRPRAVAEGHTESALHARFSGLQCGILTNVSLPGELLEVLGVASTTFLDSASPFMGLDGVHLTLPTPQAAAVQVSEQLGVTDVASGKDMLMLLVDSSAAASDGDDMSAATALLAWLDEVMHRLNKMPNFSSCVLSSLVLTSSGRSTRAGVVDWGSTLLPGMVWQTVDGAEELPEGPAGFPVHKPTQSCDIPSTGNKACGILVRHLPGVIRQTRASCLSMEQYMEHASASTLHVKYLLPELAYKLGRAAKYGA